MYICYLIKDLVLKKILQIYTLTFFLAAIFISCEKELMINKELKPDITLNCLFSEDSTISAFLSYTKSPYLSSNFKYIDNAIIVVKNREKAISFTHQNDGFYLSDVKPQIFGVYNIEVDIPGVEKLEAESSIPNNIEIDTLTTEVSFIDEGNKILKIDLKIKISQQPAFLIFRHIVEKKILSSQNDTLMFQDTSWLSANDGKSLKLPENLNKIAFYYLKENANYNLEINSFDGFKKNSNLLEGISKFEVIDCSKDYFEYMISNLLYNSSTKESQTTIINPVDYYSNIKNGIGIFAGYRILRINKMFH